MRRKFLNLYKVSLVVVFSVILISVIGVKKTQSYYGGLGLGSYGGYGGLYGGYGGLSSMYGGMYGGMMGGMYGGMYGGMMGGMYGGMMGGMYGGMMGGMYGGMMGGMYGGMMGGMYSPFGMQNMYYSIDTGTGLNYQVPFMQIAPMLGIGGLYNSMFPSVFASDYARAAQQVIAALYDALIADPFLGPSLLADPVALDILASDAALGAVVAANPLWLSLHSWLVIDEPLLLSTVAVSCIQCHSNVSSGALLPSFPLPAQLI